MAKKPTYAELARRIKDLEAQSATNMRSAFRDIEKADDRFMASAVIITVTALGGREVVNHFAIRDGLSGKTIAAIKEDIKRTMDLSGFEGNFK